MRPAIGQTYWLREPDYRFGTGAILAVVTKVIEEAEYNGEPWWTVQGHVSAVMHDYFGPWEYRAFLQVRGPGLDRLKVKLPGPG
jgi:hypothetical protein